MSYYDKRSEKWCLGVILFRLFHKHFLNPFIGASKKEFKNSEMLEIIERKYKDTNFKKMQKEFVENIDKNFFTQSFQKKVDTKNLIVSLIFNLL